MCAVLSKKKEELAIPFKTEEFIADALLDSSAGTHKVANHKGIELGKQYQVSYNYCFKPLEVNNIERNEFSVRFVGGFGYSYGYRLNNAVGVMPSEPVYQGVDTKTITCTKTEESGSELIRVRVTGAKGSCRVWNVSLTEV